MYANLKNDQTSQNCSNMSRNSTTVNKLLKHSASPGIRNQDIQPYCTPIRICTWLVIFHFTFLTFYLHFVMWIRVILCNLFHQKFIPVVAKCLNNLLSNREREKLHYALKEKRFILLQISPTTTYLPNT